MQMGFRPDEPAEVVIRPEDLEVTTVEQGKVQVRVDSLLFRGVHYEICCYDDDGNEWLVHSTKRVKVGDRIGLYFDPDDIHVMRIGETGPSSTVDWSYARGGVADGVQIA